jgi:DHA1 family multidrug resistance protein-like MFS transporter
MNAGKISRPPGGRISWQANLTALLAAETLAITGFALVMPVMPLFLKDEMGIADPSKLKLWVGLVQSSGAVALAFFAPIWGHLADVYSRRLMLMRAMFGGTIAISLISLAQAPWQVLVLRTVQGALTGTVAAATVLAAGISPASQLAFTLGMLQTGIAVGNTIGPLIGGVISDFLGHRVVFVCTGMTLAAAGFVVMRFVQDDPRDETDAKPKGSFIPDVRPILASPVLITLLAVSFAIQAANTIAEPMLPLFLQTLSSDPSLIGSTTGIVLGVGAVAAALASVIVGRYALRLGYWRALIFCLGGAALFNAPQAFVGNALQLGVFRFCASFFIGGAIPVLNALIGNNADKDSRGTVYGFNSSVSCAGGALGPVIGSALAMLTYRDVFFGTAVFLALASAGAALQRVRLGKREAK